MSDTPHADDAHEGLEHRRPGPALEAVYKNLVTDLIIDGQSNKTIRQKLAEAGYPHGLSESGIDHYRRKPAVKSAKDARLLAARQSGMGEMATRINMLSDLIGDMRKRLAGDIAIEDRIHIVGEIRKLSKLLSSMLDPRQSSTLEVTGAGGGPIQTINIHTTVNPNVKGVWNDMLKMYAEEQGVLLMEPGNPNEVLEAGAERDPLEGEE